MKKISAQERGPRDVFSTDVLSLVTDFMSIKYEFFLPMYPKQLGIHNYHHYRHA